MKFKCVFAEIISMHKEIKYWCKANIKQEATNNMFDVNKLLWDIFSTEKCNQKIKICWWNFFSKGSL